MAEIKFSVLSPACLRRRNADHDSPELPWTPACQSATLRQRPLTGASLPRTPEQNSVDSTPAILDLTRH